MNLQELVKKGAVTFSIRVIGAVLTFISTLFFANILGASDFGLFSLGLTIITIVSVFVRAGVDNVILKQVSAHWLSEREVAESYIYYSTVIVLAIGCAATVLVWVFADVIAVLVFNKKDFAEVLRVFSYMLIPFSLVVILSETNKALGKAGLSAFYQTVFPPTVTLLIAGSLWVANNLTVEGVVLAVGAGFFASMLTNLIGMKSHIAIPPVFALRYVDLLKQGMHMLLVSSGALFMAWTDVIILGLLSTSENVGVYAVATRIVMVTTLLLTSINAITAPRYAKLHKDGDLKGMAELAQKSAVILLGMILIPTSIMLIFPAWMMGWFGGEFVVGSTALIILAIGQFVNVVCGSVGYLLTMTGKEKKFRDILFVTAILNVALSVNLIEVFGIEGVAFATAFSVITWNIWAMVEVRRHLGFWSIAPFIQFKRNLNECSKKI